ncbi:hypothetical protein FRB90_002102 [Tulasnella sp. 427]|nr:hypothetical protein FRB90_002102 [Tulasnella sp. 427]
MNPFALESSFRSTYNTSPSTLKLSQDIDPSHKRLKLQQYLSSLIPQSLFPPEPHATEHEFFVKVSVSAYNGDSLTIPRHSAMQPLVTELSYLSLTARIHQNPARVSAPATWANNRELLTIPSLLQQGKFVYLDDLSASFPAIDNADLEIYKGLDVLATDTFASNASRTMSLASLLYLKNDPLSAYFGEVREPGTGTPPPWWLQLISDDNPNVLQASPPVPGVHFADSLSTLSAFQASHPSVYRQFDRTMSFFSQLMVVRTGVAYVFYFQPTNGKESDASRAAASGSVFDLQFDYFPPFLSSTGQSYTIEWTKLLPSALPSNPPTPDPTPTTARGSWIVVKLAPGAGLFIPPGAIYNVFFEGSYTGRVYRFLHRTFVPRVAASLAVLGRSMPQLPPEAHVLARRTLSVLLSSSYMSHPRLSDHEKSCFLTLLSYYTALVGDEPTSFVPVLHKHYPHPVIAQPVPVAQLWTGLSTPAHPL